jgi:hypothetical protein
LRRGAGRQGAPHRGDAAGGRRGGAVSAGQGHGVEEQPVAGQTTGVVRRCGGREARTPGVPRPTMVAPRRRGGLGRRGLRGRLRGTDDGGGIAAWTTSRAR